MKIGLDIGTVEEVAVHVLIQCDGPPIGKVQKLGDNMKMR